MPAKTNMIVFQEDIYGRRPDGRKYLIVPAGVPIRDTEARKLGIVPFKPGEVQKLPQPSEIKAAEDEQEPAYEVNATDGAIKLAAEYGIDLAGLVGTGKGGRVIVNDVRKMIDQK